MVEHEEQKTLESMTAADVMTAAPLTCSTFSTVLEAVMIFRDADCGAVPILEEGRPVAILTDRDVALALAELPRPGQPPRQRDHDSRGSWPSRPRIPWARSARCSGPRRSVASWWSTPAGRLLGIIGWADIAPVLSDRMMGRLVTDVVVHVRERSAIAGGSASRLRDGEAPPEPRRELARPGESGIASVRSTLSVAVPVPSGRCGAARCGPS